MLVKVMKMNKMIKAGVIGCAMLASSSALASNNNNNNDEIPFAQNVGQIQSASSEMATAIMLNSRLVLGPAHASCVYNSAEDQIFIQSCEYVAPISLNPITGEQTVKLSDTITELKNRNIPFSRYDVIYAPQKIAHLPSGLKVNLRDRIALSKEVQELFAVQANVEEIFKEDKGIDGFTYPGGDWVILKLRTPLPVSTLPLQPFKAAELSGLDSFCIGAERKAVMNNGGANICVTRKTLKLNPVYRADRDVFYTSVNSLGAQDDSGLLEDNQLPKQIVTAGMSAGPVFFLKEGKWVLGAVVSTNLCDTMLKQLYLLSQDQSTPAAVRINADVVVRQHITKPYPVYSLFASLEGVHGKVKELILKSLEVAPAKK